MGIQRINELFGLAQGALAQQAMTRRETGSDLAVVAAVHAAYFEEMAAHQEADPAEADESELSDDDAPPTGMDPTPETRVDLEGDPPLVDDQFEEEVLEPPHRDDAELPRHPDVDEHPTPEEGRTDGGGGATAGGPSPTRCTIS
jgi:hypothetical protein